MYRIVDLEQGTPEWLEWRRGGITASDAPVIMGLDPYGKKPWDLWMEKRGLSEGKPKNQFILDKGHDFEKRVRAKYELMQDKIIPGTCIEMDDCPVLRASLDGLDKETGSLVEIKMVGKLMLESPEIPPHHYCQFMAQMMIAEAPDLLEIYGLIDEFNELKDKQRLVLRDEPYIVEMKPILLEFKRMVDEGIEPEKPVRRARKAKV
jgi:putative phage-type endonuclease